MISRIFQRSAGLIGITILGAVLSIGPTTHAQVKNATQGIRLSPAIIELNATPGGTYTLTVQVMNVTTADLDYKVEINDFAAKDETGSPSVLNDKNSSPDVSVQSWVSTVPTFHLNKGKSIGATFIVKVPPGAEPGGHYGVLQFSGTEPRLKGTGVGMTTSAGTLVLIKVAGDIKENANIASFTTFQNGKQTNFFENSPVDFVTRIQNTGNIHVKPFGSIEVKNMFGATVATLPVNSTKGNVLPNSIRRFDNTDGGYMIGSYTATVTLGYGTHGQVIMASTTFWVIPWRLIGTIILVLALAVFILRRLQKAYNKRVIKKYQNKNDEPKKGKSKKK